MIDIKSEYANVSNVSTNMFETITGVMNIAPEKISGSYKIVIASRSNGYKLYLDDYNGRRIELDETKQFMSQVGNFLSVKTKVSDKTKLGYGGYQSNKVKSWHIPLYLGNDQNYPRYFVVSRVPNTHITEDNLDILYSSANIVDVIDLKKINIHGIFDEIYSKSNFRFPIKMDWENSIVEINGYDYTKLSQTTKHISLIDTMSNKPSLEQVNNMLLNSFSDNNMIFPKFLNLEFEFDYKNEQELNQHFNNFYGYLSNENITGNVSNVNDLNKNLYAVIKDETSSRSIEQYKLEEINPTMNLYTQQVGNVELQDILENRYLYRINVKGYQVGDSFKITNESDDEILDYTISSLDVRENLYQTFKRIAHKIDATNSYVTCNCYIYKEKVIIEFVADEKYKMLLSNYQRYDVLDRRESDTNFNWFECITEEDVQMVTNNYLNENLSNRITIENEDYTIVDNFKYRDYYILRLDRNPMLTSKTMSILYDHHYEKIVRLNPIAFLSYDSNLKSEKSFEFYLYKEHIKNNFISNINSTSLDFENRINNEHFNTKISPYIIDYDVDTEDVVEYKLRCNAFHSAWINFNKYFDSSYQYVDSDFLNDKSSINTTAHNENVCLNMMFNIVGCTAYITPYVFNYWTDFYNNNGGLYYGENSNKRNQLDYSWFLIKGICPEYLNNDIRKFRYFKDKISLTSRLTKCNNNQVETTFLGVKYRLPQKFQNYNFAVYVDLNNKENVNVNYQLLINNLEKTVYLTINKYIKYQDFLRFGNEDNEPYIDLSFFHNQIKGSNDTDTNPVTMHDIGYIYGTAPLQSVVENENITFRGTPINDWIYNNSDGSISDYYLLIRRSNRHTIDFTTLYTENMDIEFSHYVDILRFNPETDEIEEYSVRMLKGIFKNVTNVNQSYFWCKDIEYVFYPDEFYIWNNEVDVNNNKVYRLISNVYEPNTVSVDVISQNFIKKYVQTIGVESLGMTDIEEIMFLMNNSLNQPNSFSYQLNMLKNRTISFRNQYYKLFYDVIYPDTINKTLFVFRDDVNSAYNTSDKIFYDQSITFNDIEDVILNDQYDMTSIRESTEFDMFMRNAVWSILKGMCTNCKSNHTSDSQVANDLYEYKIHNLIKYSNNNLIPSNDDSISYKLEVIDAKNNSVVWKKNDEKHVFNIFRFDGEYNPYMHLVNSEIDFQTIKNKIKRTVFNIYDKNYAHLLCPDNYDINTNATGIWNEVEGNIISSLFTNDIDLFVNTPYSQRLNVRELLKSILIIDNFLINDYNTNHIINNISGNVNEYIMDKYTEYLLDNHYYLYSIVDENNKTLDFTYDETNNHIATLNNTATNVILTFKRK